MRFCTLSSGSSGNAAFVSDGGAHLLVDIGVSLRELTRRLAALGTSVHQLSGLLLTHEHIDHVRGLYQFALRTEVPIYGDLRTLRAILPQMQGIMPDRFTAFGGLGAYDIGGLAVTPFEVPHDVPCLGYRIDGHSASMGYATDMGHLAPTVMEGLAGVQMALIEANHDLFMLKNGPYPASLKRRVASMQGHLSNEDAGTLACHLLNGGCRHFVLGHLSTTNNLPQLALEAVCGALQSNGAQPGHVTVDVAPRYETGQMFEFGSVSAIAY